MRKLSPRRSRSLSLITPLVPGRTGNDFADDEESEEKSDKDEEFCVMDERAAPDNGWAE